jgi:pyridoxine kinase
MRTILSIQSHVAYGYVGNKAAVPPLQALGYNVIDVNTVHFSNHTGYGSWTGKIVPPEDIRALLDGIRVRGGLCDIAAVLTGYMGNAALGEIVLETLAEIRSYNPGVIYCCDPVMGDVGRGFFVQPEIPPFFRDTALPRATIATPNLFELSWLTGTDIVSEEDALAAGAKLLETGPDILLVTSLLYPGMKTGTIRMLAMTRNEIWQIATPRLDLQVNGAGDAIAALFLGHYLETRDIRASLERAATAIFNLFERTALAGGREIALIAALEDFRAKKQIFCAEKLEFDR